MISPAKIYAVLQTALCSLELLTFVDRDTYTQRIEYMQTWKYIRTCIRAIQHPHHVYKDIVSLEYDRAKILPFGNTVDMIKKMVIPVNINFAIL